MIIGIDPGISGAFALLTKDGKLEGIDLMPLLGDGSVSYVGVKEILTKYQETTLGPKAYLERAVSFGMGTKGAFNYGRSFAAVELALIELCIRFELVEPRRWTKEIFKGVDASLKTKLQAGIAFRRLFPTLVDLVPTTGKKEPKPHEGVVDAILIAEYGRRSS